MNLKSILYIVAVVVLLAGAWFSYSSKQAFDQLRTERVDLDAKNVKRKADIDATKKEAKEMEGQRDAANAKLVEAEEGLDNIKDKLGLAKKESAKWKSKIAGQQEKLDKNKELIEQVKKSFADLGPNVELDQIPALVQKLEDDLKQANKELEELQELANAADERVAGNTKTIKELETRIAKRAARIRGNSAEGRVTAVNHDWGFVTLDIPSNMPITAEAKLMIKRGTNYIGNLNINAIEGSRIVADIDYSSMTPGMVVQPGDNVILAKPVTN